MRKIIFITGATSGIGKATAKLFAKNNYDIVITGRRNERLIQLAKTLTETYKVDVLPLCFDVRNKVEVKAAITSLPEKWTKIDVLLNNAGLAVGLDKIQSISYEVKGLQETLLGFGTIVIQTYVGELVIHEVHHPKKIQKQMSHILRDLGLHLSSPPQVTKDKDS